MHFSLMFFLLSILEFDRNIMYEFGELGVLGCMIDGLFVFFRLLFYH